MLAVGISIYHTSSHRHRGLLHPFNPQANPPTTLPHPSSSLLRYVDLLFQSSLLQSVVGWWVVNVVVQRRISNVSLTPRPPFFGFSCLK
jgi:hypothetical protein